MTTLILKWLALFLLCFVAQSTVVHAFGVAGITPDLLLICLFFLSIKHGEMAGTFVGFALGLLQDLYSPSILGQNALAKTIAGFVAGLLNERVLRTDPLLKAAIFVGIFLLHDALFFWVQTAKASGTPVMFLSQLALRGVPRAAYSVLVMAVYYIYESRVAPLLRR
jgi:rod shape-determining protein MreD